MGLTTYNLNETRWAISLTYYIFIYTYPKENVSHRHRLELVIPSLNSRIYVSLNLSNSKGNNQYVVN